MCCSQAGEKGSEEDRGANSVSWLVACRSNTGSDFPVWLSLHGTSRRVQTGARLAQAQVTELFPSLGKGLHLAQRFRESTSDLDSSAATEWGHAALGPSTWTACQKKSFWS